MIVSTFIQLYDKKNHFYYICDTLLSVTFVIMKKSSDVKLHKVVQQHT